MSKLPHQGPLVRNHKMVHEQGHFSSKFIINGVNFRGHFKKWLLRDAGSGNHIPGSIWIQQGTSCPSVSLKFNSNCKEHPLILAMWQWHLFSRFTASPFSDIKTQGSELPSGTTRISWRTVLIQLLLSSLAQCRASVRVHLLSIQRQPHYPNKRCISSFHQLFKGCWSIAETKWHYCELP